MWDTVIDRHRAHLSHEMPCTRVRPRPAHLPALLRHLRVRAALRSRRTFRPQRRARPALTRLNGSRPPPGCGRVAS